MPCWSVNRKDRSPVTSPPIVKRFTKLHVAVRYVAAAVASHARRSNHDDTTHRLLVVQVRLFRALSGDVSGRTSPAADGRGSARHGEAAARTGDVAVR